MKLQPFTPEVFAQLKKSDPNYYAGRWPYLSAASELAGDLEPKTVLELGPYRQPLFGGSEVMDRHDYLSESRVQWVWDATQTPWPQGDKAYDMFIALQVWEHLGTSQAQAFKEVQRVSRTAVLSFPYKWHAVPKSDCHYGIDDAIVREWTGGVAPVKRSLIDVPDSRFRRLICVYDFQ